MKITELIDKLQKLKRKDRDVESAVPMTFRSTIKINRIIDEEENNRIILSE